MSAPPPGWTVGVDALGRTYFINLTTGATQWVHPSPPPPPPPLWDGYPANYTQADMVVFREFLTYMLAATAIVVD